MRIKIPLTYTWRVKTKLRHSWAYVWFAYKLREAIIFGDLRYFSTTKQVPYHSLLDFFHFLVRCWKYKKYIKKPYFVFKSDLVLHFVFFMQLSRRFSFFYETILGQLKHFNFLFMKKKDCKLIRIAFYRLSEAYCECLVRWNFQNPSRKLDVIGNFGKNGGLVLRIARHSNCKLTVINVLVMRI